jgi:ABC-type multidrug transport system ATPase subunit
VSADFPRHYVNPYIAGSAVSGAEMFFGREDVFAFIRRNLIGRHSNHPVVLYGQRRTGKTSVLYQLHRHLDPGYWCIFIDLHGLNLNGVGNLMQGIATVISRELRREHQVTVTVPERSEFLEDPATAFERVFLDQVWAALGDNQLVLMLDEVIRLDEEMRAGRLDRGVFEYLRHLMQHHQRLNFVFSLGSGIEEMSRDYAFLFSVSLYHRISFLEPTAARDLITRPARGHYELTERAVDRILQVTAGHPYYTQLVCHCVFDAWARNPAAAVDADGVDSVLAEAIELGSANLTYVWLDSSPAEQALMAGIASAMPGGGTAVTADQACKAWHDMGVDVPDKQLSRALRGLARREVITGGSAYSFSVDLQRLWLDQHRRLDWVKEDLADEIARWNSAEPLDEPLEAGKLPAADEASQQGSPLVALIAGRARPLDSKRVYRIGRDDRADIPLNDARVSWAHAVLRGEGATWVIEDLGSRNGTYLEGKRITRLEVTGPCVVRLGHPEDGPALRFELVPPDTQPDLPQLAAADRALFRPGVIRNPVARVPLESKVVSIGRGTGNNVVVADLTVSQQHAELRRSAAGRYSVIDLNSHSGTFVNGTRVNQQELQENDIVAIGHATFQLAGGALHEYVDEGRATLEAHDLQVTAGHDSDQQVLLSGITFPLPERSMLAVIGPAGAGKSVLLNALTGRNPATSGRVTYDFRDLYGCYDELRNRLGLVPPEPVTDKRLTARAALSYAAGLRLAPDVTETERKQRVEQALDELGMTAHADTLLDRQPAHYRKLVDIGLELLTSPSLLFLDEPTSALDPHLKRELFEELRRRADRAALSGQSVIVITHDVESKLIDKCDRVLVLAPGGGMAFYGPPQEGLAYFRAEDWADVFTRFRDSPTDDWAGQFRSSPEYAKYVAQPLSAPPQQETPPRRQRQQQPTQRRQRGTPAYALTMARRYLRVMRSDRVFLSTAILMPVIVGAVARATSTNFGLANSAPVSGLNINAIQLIVILLLSSVLTGTAFSIREFIKERDIYQGERLAGLSAGAYLFSKVVVLSALGVLQAALFVLIGLAGQKVPPSGVVIPGPALIEVFVDIAVLLVTSMLVGLAISTLVTKSDQAMPILAGVTVVQLALSGGLFPLAGVIGYISLGDPARWGLAAAASTINLNVIQATISQGPNGQKPDALWTHDAFHWAVSVGMTCAFGVISILIAWLRLQSVRPRR